MKGIIVMHCQADWQMSAANAKKNKDSSRAHYFHKTSVSQLLFLAQNIKATANGKAVQWPCTHPTAVRHL